MIIYVRSDGMIARKLSGSPGCAVAQPIEGLEIIEVENCPDIGMVYFDGEIKPKTEMALDYPQQSPVNSVIEITGIPDNTQVIWPDSLITTESESLSFETLTTGVYRFKFKHPKHFDQKVYINVT
jgi:hypothetical protein